MQHFGKKEEGGGGDNRKSQKGTTRAVGGCSDWDKLNLKVRRKECDRLDLGLWRTKEKRKRATEIACDKEKKKKRTVEYVDKHGRPPKGYKNVTKRKANSVEQANPSGHLPLSGEQKDISLKNER